MTDIFDSRFAEALMGGREAIAALWADLEALRREARDSGKASEAEAARETAAAREAEGLRRAAERLADPATWAGAARLLRADAPGGDPDDLVAGLLSAVASAAETAAAAAAEAKAANDRAVSALAALENAWAVVVAARPDEAGEAVRAVPPPPAPVAAPRPQARPVAAPVAVDPATAERRRQEAAAWAAHQGNGGRPSAPRRNGDAGPRPLPVREIRATWFAFLKAHNQGESVVLAPEGGLPSAAVAVRRAGGRDFRVIAVMGDPGFAEGGVVSVPALRAFAGEDVLVRKARFLGLTAADRPPVVVHDDGAATNNLGERLAAAGR